MKSLALICCFPTEAHAEDFMKLIIQKTAETFIYEKKPYANDLPDLESTQVHYYKHFYP